MSLISCDYVVARYVSNPLRDEAKNLGVILHAPNAAYLGIQFTGHNKAQLSSLVEEDDLPIIQEYIREFETTFKQYQSTRHTLFPQEQVFSKEFLPNLTRRYQGIFQFTLPRGAVTEDPEQELATLFDLFIKPEKRVHIKALEGRKNLDALVAEEFERINLRSEISHEYPIEIVNQKLVFSFGYKTPRAKKRDVVMEVVDLTGDTFNQRFRAFAPTSVKFEIAKAHRSSLTAFCLVKLPDLSTKTRKEFGLEMETLKRHTDAIYNFEDQKQRETFLDRIATDFAN